MLTSAATVETQRECDLVMKGGIASGIVYPGAVQQLHEAGYRFRNIGGTSAGAIAAGITAAAQGGGTEGFIRFKEISTQLAEGGFLVNLFQPSSSEAKIIFALVKAAGTQTGLVGRTRAVLQPLGASAGTRPAVGAAIGVAVGALPLLAATKLGAMLGFDSRSGLLTSVVGGLVGGTLGYIAGKVVGSAEALPGLVQGALSQQNAFGLCLGHEAGALASKTGELTDWLAWAIDYVGGKTNATEVAPDASPLTMGDLRRQGITFRAMTSNLNEGQPYTLPFEKKNFLFCVADMERLFPPHVVAHMVDKAHRRSADHETKRGQLPPDYHFLPHGDDFPVVLAVRMSLSFPVLISAIPLYKLRESGWGKLDQGETPDPETDLCRHWFSDGGLSSNFPIHFFDAWVPSRPTFGINLVAAPAQGKIPKPKLQPANPPNEPDTWSEVTGLGAFFNAIWSTTQNFRDNMQSQLPSYRERIVPVALTASEGGLNLDMTTTVVKEIMERGEEAGKALAGFEFAPHRWVRYLVLLKALEENLLEFKGQKSQFAALCEQQLAGKFPYRRNQAWCTEALRRVTDLDDCVSNWAEPHFESDTPKPSSVLRVTPDV